MSLLGAIGKGLLSVGSSLIPGGSLIKDAAAGVLGEIGKSGKEVGDLGAVASGAAKGSADERLREQNGLLGQQSLALTGARDQFSGDLQGAQFQQTEQDRARKAAILSALLNGTKDLSITPGNPLIAARMPQVTGGARPSNLTGNKEALLALLAQPPMQAPTYQAPPSFQLPTAGVGDQILGGVGLGGSVLGALSPLLAKIGQTKKVDELGNVNDVIDRLGARS